MLQSPSSSPLPRRHHQVTYCSLINSRRISDEYENEVKLFLDFSKTHASSSIGRFYCPRVNYLNKRRLEVEKI
ncbi:hypothetical protein CR513_42871, partial [Mucuna pruriens]